MKQFWKLGLAVVVATAGNIAEARILCSSTTSSCVFAKMPHYNQNDSTIGSDLLPNGTSKSMLCGPTAGAMALGAVVSEVSSRSNIGSSSWTSDSFVGSSTLTFQERQRYRIRAMASLMSANPNTGTSSLNVAKGVYQRNVDFDRAGGQTSGNPVAYTNQNYIDYVKNTKSAVVILHGHYLRSSKTSYGKTYYSYVRTGGHYVTLNGYSGSTLLIYNPWYAAKDQRKISMISAGCNSSGICQNLPGGLAKRALLYSSGSSFKFIDFHTRLWAE